MNLKGFTLVELVVVMAMISVLALTSMVGYDRFISRARDTKAEEVVLNLQNEVFAETSLSGITVNVGTEVSPVWVKVTYDVSQDAFTFYKASQAPNEEESIKALEAVLGLIVDSDVWDINPLSSSSEEVLSIYYDLDTFLTIDYTATFGGHYVWKPTYIRTTL